MKRLLPLALFTLQVLSGLHPAQAQEKYPSKPVTLIVPQAAGGANDAIARVRSEEHTSELQSH